MVWVRRPIVVLPMKASSCWREVRLWHLPDSFRRSHHEVRFRPEGRHAQSARGMSATDPERPCAMMPGRAFNAAHNRSPCDPELELTYVPLDGEPDSRRGPRVRALVTGSFPRVTRGKAV